MLRVADCHVFGIDLGVSDGMQDAMDHSPFAGLSTLERLSLPEWAEAIAASRAEQPGAWQTLSALVDRYAPKWHVHE
jgi:hypothetical protein